MALTKSDLSAIRQVVREETKPQFESLKKKADKLDKKFTKLFNFLDKEWSRLKRRTDNHDKILRVDTSEI